MFRGCDGNLATFRDRKISIPPAAIAVSCLLMRWAEGCTVHLLKQLIMMCSTTTEVVKGDPNNNNLQYAYSVPRTTFRPADNCVSTYNTVVSFCKRWRSHSKNSKREAL
jgi:hypothetical protein